MKKLSQATAARIARQIAENSGIEVRFGSAIAVLPVDQRDAFKV